VEYSLPVGLFEKDSARDHFSDERIVGPTTIEVVPQVWLF
jgi:hypothetical protein